MNAVTLSIISLLIITAILDLILGIIVLLRNTKKRLNRRFFVLAVSGTLWVVTNILFFIASNELVLLIALLSYSAAALLSTAFLFFCIELSDIKLPHRKNLLFLIISAFVVVVSAIPGFLATGITENKAIITNSIPLIVYGLWLLLNFAGGIAVLVIAYRKSFDRKRNTLRIVLIGLTCAAIMGLTFNLVLPLVNDYRYVGLGPAAVLWFVAAASYAIVRHRLFDIRTVAARTVAYIFTIFLVVVVYATLIYAVARYIYPESAATMGQNVLNIFLAVIVALVFQPLKRVFDRLTDRVFFRGTYTPQDIFDKISEIIASRVTPRQLTSAISENLQSMMSIQSVKIHFEERSHQNGFPTNEVVKQLETSKSMVLIVDDLYSENEGLYESLYDINIAAVVRLRTAKKNVGFLCLSTKLNGNAYNSRDIEVLKVVGGELSVALQNALRLDEIQSFNETLEVKINEATNKLKVSNKKLVEIDKSKDEFISMASHQLRTPLTSVKGYISMMLDGDVGKISLEQRAVLEQAFDSSQRMVFLIGDFLNVSRLQTGKFMLEVSTIDFTQLVAEEVDQLRDTAKMHQMMLDYTRPSVSISSIADENKLRQVMMNFMDNAIYYSTPGTTIQVQLLSDAKHITFKVKDTGIGVPKSEQAKLFTKFFRATNARSQRPDGTGIGLYMAKKVIVAHGGSILFESKEGKGSTFGFRLPLKHDTDQLGDQKDTTATDRNG